MRLVTSDAVGCDCEPWIFHLIGSRDGFGVQSCLAADELLMTAGTAFIMLTAWFLSVLRSLLHPGAPQLIML